jgi:site-specific DNA-cytosine methylase
MAGAKRRSPTSTLVTKHSIQNAGSILEGLPEKPKEIWSLREAIDALKDEITLALDRGYTYPEISQMLTTRGVEISASTLKYYLSSVKRQDPNAKPRRRRRTLGVGISADSLNLGVSDPVVPKKRGRKPKAVVEAAAAAAAAEAEAVVPKKRGRKPGVKNAVAAAVPAEVKATRKPRVAKATATKKTAVKDTTATTATKKTAVKATAAKTPKATAAKATATKKTAVKDTTTKKTATATKAKTGTGRGRRKAAV